MMKSYRFILIIIRNLKQVFILLNIISGSSRLLHLCSIFSSVAKIDIIKYIKMTTIDLIIESEFTEEKSDILNRDFESSGDNA